MYASSGGIFGAVAVHDSNVLDHGLLEGMNARRGLSVREHFEVCESLVTPNKASKLPQYIIRSVGGTKTSELPLSSGNER